MDWPPVKAWTYIHKITNTRYFVAINYGCSKGFKWVNLVSVISSDLCFRVNFDQLNDQTIWQPGWINLNIELIKDQNENKILYDLSNCYAPACLHPSNDSGLLITDSNSKSRPWFPD